MGNQLGILRLVLSEQFLLALPKSGSDRLTACVEKTRAFVLACLRDGQASGELRADLPAETLAPILPGAVERDGDDALLVSATADAIPGAVRALAASGVEVFAVERRASTLEDFFLEVTGGETV